MKRRYKILLSLGGLMAVAVGAFAVALAHSDACPSSMDASPNDETSMQAIRAHCYGAPGQLSLERIPRPVPHDDELLVRVHAAGVNPLDWHHTHGEPYFMRLSTGFGRPDDPATGVDFAGTVVEVGARVARFKPGDAVFGGRRGAFAEYMIVREAATVALKPAGVSFEDAAVVPVAATTALQALRDAGQVQAGQRVLINGASGGVGTYAVQIAKSLGAHVTGVSSGRNTAFIRSLGADETIDYTVRDFTEGEAKYDVIVDNVGNRDLSDYRRALVPNGRLVMVTGPKTNPWLGPIGRMAWAGLTSPFVDQAQETVMASLNPADLATLAAMLDADTLRSTIDRRFTLAQVPDAIAYLEQGRTRGKNVIVVAAE